MNVPDDLVSVRYMVDDVQTSVDYYTSSRQILVDDPSGNPIELFQPAGQ